jgi:hypothetical protein
MRGTAIAGLLLEIEIMGIVCKKQITKKYMFGALLNWLKRFRGRKVKALYFEVLI